MHPHFDSLFWDFWGLICIGVSPRGTFPISPIMMEDPEIIKVEGWGSWMSQEVSRSMGRISGFSTDNPNITPFISKVEPMY